MLTRMFIILTAVLVLTACASGGPTRVEAEEAYIRHAGPELNRVRYSGFIQGWQPVGDDSVLMSFSRNEYYLFELSPPCNLELRQATHIALKTSMRQSIGQFDRVQVGNLSCRINAIRKVDFEAAQAEIQDRRDQGSEFDRTVEHETDS